MSLFLSISLVRNHPLSALELSLPRASSSLLSTLRLRRHPSLGASTCQRIRFRFLAQSFCHAGFLASFDRI